MKTEADGASLGDVESGGSAHGLNESPLDVEQAAEAIARADQGIAGASIDQAEPLQVLEVKDEAEARPRGVPCIRHAQRLKSLGLHLTGDANGRMFTTKGFGNAVVVRVEEDWLLEVGIETGRQLAAAVWIGSHCGDVPAVQLRQEWEDEVASH